MVVIDDVRMIGVVYGEAAGEVEHAVVVAAAVCLAHQRQDVVGWQYRRVECGECVGNDGVAVVVALYGSGDETVAQGVVWRQRVQETVGGVVGHGVVRSVGVRGEQGDGGTVVAPADGIGCIGKRPAVGGVMAVCSVHRYLHISIREKNAKTKINPRPLTGLEKLTQRERGKGEG